MRNLHNKVPRQCIPPYVISHCRTLAWWKVGDKSPDKRYSPDNTMNTQVMVTSPQTAAVRSLPHTEAVNSAH